ncbi:MAG: choice-of-anchor E domain-containing protein [Candidatus Krumholzibacteriota bacterium]|nr:choice-of-anchor E domain-containing protein [Candidatus Krumholzibacteriota bacterium]
MRRIRTKQWLCGVGLGVVLAAGLIGSAVAETIHYHDEFTRDTPFNETLSFPLFDPALGELTEVLIEWDSYYEGTLYLENIDPDNSADWFVDIWAYAYSLFCPDWGGEFYSVNNYAADYYGILEPFDGAIDYDGPSGLTWPLSAEAASSEYVPPGSSWLSMYIGPGDIEFTMSCNADSDWHTEGGQCIAEARSEGGFAIDVTYTYVPLTPARSTTWGKIKATYR